MKKSMEMYHSLGDGEASHSHGEESLQRVQQVAGDTLNKQKAGVEHAFNFDSKHCSESNKLHRSRWTHL